MTRTGQTILRRRAALEVGQEWQGIQRQHRGWVVRILSQTDAKVKFRCLDGPGHSRGVQQHMRVNQFFQCFAPVCALPYPVSREGRHLGQAA